MKITSWNVNSLNMRLQHVCQWANTHAPAVIGLQETKMEDYKFPLQELADLGYHSVFAGQKSYNGVAILSRHPCQDACTSIPGFSDPQRRVLAATVDGVRIINLYVVNGQDVGTEKYAYKLRWLTAVRAWIAQQMQQYPALVVMGDFNIAPADNDVYNPKVWNDSHILTSTAERAELEALLALGLFDSYRLLYPQECCFSWWDYRGAGYARNHGLRIDLILVSSVLRERVVAAGIDQAARAWEKPSDHAPVWVQFG